VLDRLTNGYEFHMFFMEKRMVIQENPLTIHEIREELSLRYERQSLVGEKTNEIDLTEENALFTTQFKRNRQNW
jgi:hypothetical protein